MKKKFLLFFNIFIVIAILPSTSKGEEIVLAWPHFPPRYIFQANGTYEGIDVEIVQELARRLNLTLITKEYPWLRCHDMMKHGEIDLMTYLIKKPEREKYMLYLESPYITKSDKCFYVKKGKSHIIQKYEDLHKFSIGVIKGNAYFERFDQDMKIDKQAVVSEKHLIRMLDEGRFDTFLGTCVDYDFNILEMGYQHLYEKAQYRYSKKVLAYITISKKSPYTKHIQKFNRAMKEMVKEKVVEKITNSFIKKWALKMKNKANKSSQQ